MSGDWANSKKLAFTMSSTATPDIQHTSSPGKLSPASIKIYSSFLEACSRADVEASIAGPKSKKHKKKKAGIKSKPNGETGRTNGIKIDDENENEEVDEEEPEPKTLTATIQPPIHEDPSSENGSAVNGGTAASHNSSQPKSIELVELGDRDLGNNDVEVSHLKTAPSMDRTTQDSKLPALSADTEARLDALAKERIALRDEVSQLRRSLEQIQGKHEEELGSVRAQLEETEGEKEHAETQYRSLLGRVNTIKSQLGERLKADAVCIKRLKV